MGSVRTALVPLVAMPVSLVGAAIVMFAFGFSLNLLTILAIVLSVGLVVDDAIVVVENVERHVREGKSRIEAALVGARELVGPIIAMTITLAAVYTPIGFQGGLTGSLFLEFAITLAAAVVVSGIVAVTLSPVMSSRFVHAHGKEGRLTALVNRGFEAVRRVYARLLDGALQMRWAIVAASLLIMAAAWPLYMFSRQELAPVEDQSHISLFFEASPDSSLAATNRDSLEVVKAITAFPETEFMWSLTAQLGRLRRHGREGLERARALDRADVRRGVRRGVAGARACACSRGSIRRCRRPGQYDVELVLQSDAPPEQMLETVGRGGRRRLAERQVPVRRHRPQDRPARGARGDRPRAGSPTSGSTWPASARSSARCSAAAYVNRFNYFDRSYKVIPQIGDAGPRDGRPAARPQDQDAERRAGAGLDVHAHRDQHRAAHAEPLPAAQRGADLRRRQAGRHEGGGAARAGGRRGRRRAVRASCSTTPASRGRSATRASALTVTLGFAVVLIYLVLAAQFQSFRDPLIVLLGSVPLAISGALVFSFLDLTTINIYSQVGLITLVGLIAKNGILIVRVREHAAGARAREDGRAARGVADPAAAGADDLGGDGVRPLPAGARVRARAPRRATASAWCWSPA